MDLIEALNLWDNLGTTNSYYDENNNYVIKFINKNGEVVGHFTTYPGQGFKWDYPQELMDKKKKLDEIANMSLEELERF